MSAKKTTKKAEAPLSQSSRASRFKKSLPLTIMALPAFLYIFIFNYIPLYGLVLPFKDYKPRLGFLGSKWIGFKNFEFLLNNEQLIHAVKNTLMYNVVFIILGTAISVFVALMLYEMSRTSVKIYQTAIFVPHYISWVIAAYVFMVFLDMDYGILNKIITSLGGDAVLWYNNPKYWPVILTIAHIWKGFGYSAVIYYSALMGLDESLFEAAELDGAGKLKQMWYISLPGIRNMIIMLFIMHIGKIFNADFGMFYNISLNSPLLYKTTDVIDTYIYRTLIELGDVGLSSSVSMLQAVLGFILVITTNTIVNKIDSDSALY